MRHCYPSSFVSGAGVLGNVLWDSLVVHHFLEVLMMSPLFVWICIAHFPSFMILCCILKDHRYIERYIRERKYKKLRFVNESGKSAELLQTTADRLWHFVMVQCLFLFYGLDKCWYSMFWKNVGFHCVQLTIKSCTELDTVLLDKRLLGEPLGWQFSLVG